MMETHYLCVMATFLSSKACVQMWCYNLKPHLTMLLGFWDFYFSHCNTRLKVFPVASFEAQLQYDVSVIKIDEIV
jgi:hypothetical protein